MKLNKLITILLILSSCANVSMPTGGPRDETPPTLVSSKPLNNEKNFNRKFIELTFNEDIKLKDPKEEILIVPTLGKNTLFSVNKRKLTITPEFELQNNTTYSINFREGVQDITEGNPAENLRLAFSTGLDIDSLSISGKVNNLLTEIVPQKITIAIYQSDTFDIYKHSPTYFTKSNKEGSFSIPNLKPGTYYIYAYDDKNKNLKVDSKTEKFAFSTKPIQLISSQDSIELSLTMIDSRPLTLSSIRHTDKTSRIRFNKQIDSLFIKGLSSENSIYTYGTDKSELIFYNAFPKDDSIKTTLLAKDSVGQKIDTTFFIKYGNIKTSEESFKVKDLYQNYSYPTKLFTYTLNYNKPLSHITLDSIYIRYDSINIKPLETSNIKIDTLLNQLTILSTIDPFFKEEKIIKDPQLILAEGALVTIAQDSSKRIVKTIKLLKEEDLASVSIKVTTTSTNYIVQILTADGTIIQSITNAKDYIFKYLEPQEYKLRVIIDSNNNNKWDVGNFYSKKESEKIILIKSDEGKYTFPLRANWEYGPVLIKF